MTVGRLIFQDGSASARMPLPVSARASRARRGATVTGFDSSAGMLELARQRLGPDADLHLADLGRPLPFPDNAFDDVIACSVLHYLQDWTDPLAELCQLIA